MRLHGRYTFAALLGHAAESSRINCTSLWEYSFITSLKAGVTFDADFADYYRLLPAGRCSSDSADLRTRITRSFARLKETFRSGAINIVAARTVKLITPIAKRGSFVARRDRATREFSLSRTATGIVIKCQLPIGISKLLLSGGAVSSDGALNCSFSSPVFPTRLSFIDCFYIRHVLVRSLLELLRYLGNRRGLTFDSSDASRKILRASRLKKWRGVSVGERLSSLFA